MDFWAYGSADPMTIPRIATAVREAQIGDEIRVWTDVSAIVSEMRAFAHMSGNRVLSVEEKMAIMMDMQERDPHFYAPVPGSTRASHQYWVVVLAILPTNKLVKRS